MRFGRNDYDRQRTLDFIPEDEPVLLLRAQDEGAVQTVRNYAHYLRVSGAPAEIYESVWSHADRMEAWLQKSSTDPARERHSQQQSATDEQDADLLNMA